MYVMNQLRLRRMSFCLFMVPFVWSSNLKFVAGGYVVVQEKLPNYVVPDLTDFKVLYVIPPLLMF